MPPLPAEGMAQHELLLLLRAHIDTATRYPTYEAVTKAVDFAKAHPRALRGRHFARLLGVRRWRWLAEQGVYPGRVTGTTTAEIIEPEKKGAKEHRARATLAEVRQQIRILQGVLAMLVPDDVVPTAIPAIREFAPTLDRWIELWTPTPAAGDPS